MSRPDPGLQQLTRAIELLREHRLTPACGDAEFLNAHPDLRELLEPLLADASGEAPATGPAITTLGDYRLLRELGRGGMGVVHEAMQISLGRRVALKVLPDHRAASPTALVRFRREAELLARMQHDHLVPVFATGEADGQHFFAMELVDGCSLATVLRALRGREPASLDGAALAQALGAELADAGAGRAIVGRSHVQAVLKCLLPIAEALAHAHAHGVVHRDVKPANVLLRRDGTPLLADFGLARDLEAPAMTRSGDFAGTPHYIAPEQIEARSGSVDGRADVFSLGASLYELLTLRRPFDGPSTEAVIAQVLRSQPPAPRRLGLRLPDDLLAVLDKALQKAPAERYPTMAAFAADLRALLELRPVSVQHPGLYTRLRRHARREPLRAAFVGMLAVGVPSLLGLGGYLIWQQPRIAAAAEHERRVEVEALLEGGYLELGEGSPRLAVERFAAAERLLPDLPETTVGLVLALEGLGRSDQAKAARERLAGSREDLRQELLGLAADAAVAEQNATPARPPVAGATPKDPLACYVRGMRWLTFAHDSGDLQAYRDAAAALLEALQRAPAARALYHCQYLHALYHLQEPERIRDFARVVEDLWPESPIVRYWVAFALEELDPGRAMQLQRAVVAARPDLTLPHASMARMHERGRHFDEAVACYRTMLAITPRDPNALIGLSRVLANADRADEALPIAEQAVEAAPISHMAHLAVAAALLDHRRLDEALASTQRALQLTPRDPECHLMLAKVRQARGEFEAAAEATLPAIALAPKDIVPHQLAARAWTALGRATEAAASLERVVALQPGHALAWNDLAWQREALGDATGAAAAIEQALAHGNDQPAVHLAVGNWHKRHGDTAAAERHFLRAIELDPAAGPARVNLAAIRWKQGDMAEAIRLYREAASAWPDLEPASEGLARALAMQSQHDESLAERRRWAEAHADDLVAWLRLAANLLRRPTGVDFAAALAAVDRAEALTESPRADVLYWRAEVLRQRGDPVDAFRAFYEQALDLPNCSAELHKQIAERLEQLAR